MRVGQWDGEYQLNFVLLHIFSGGVYLALFVVADFLLIVLKDLLLRRADLRIVLMSATLNAKLFSSFFDGAPLCHISVSGFVFCFSWHTELE